jgi:hypothetical protein
MIADENLRHAAATAQGHHLLATDVIEFNVDFAHFNPLAGEQRFGIAAVWTRAGGVHDDFGHDKNPLWVRWGRLGVDHGLMPA